jgi:chromosome segregation ATPase
MNPKDYVAVMRDARSLAEIRKQLPTIEDEILIARDYNKELEDETKQLEKSIANLKSELAKLQGYKSRLQSEAESLQRISDGIIKNSKDLLDLDSLT